MECYVEKIFRSFFVMAFGIAFNLLVTYVQAEFPQRQASKLHLSENVTMTSKNIDENKAQSLRK